MRHPAISKMVKKRFHRTRSVKYICRRGHYNQVRFQNRSFNFPNTFSVLAGFFAL